MPPKNRNGSGRYLSDPEVAERRRLSAQLRAEGAVWRVIAETHWNGDERTAAREVKRFWAEQPRETVEEIRAMMLAKLDGLETRVREVMARRHYIVSEGRVVRDHTNECRTAGGVAEDGGLCRCPKLEDGKPIYDGVAQVRQLVETQLKLIPGLAAPKRMEVLDDDAIAREIEQARAELQREAEQLAAQRIAERTQARDAGGASGTAEGSG